jgi:hypothetical protein
MTLRFLAPVLISSAAALLVQMAWPSHCRGQQTLGWVDPQLVTPPSDLVFGSAMILTEEDWPAPYMYPPLPTEGEAKALANIQDRTLRYNGMLQLRIDGRRILRIFDIPHQMREAGGSIHRFEGWLPVPRMYAVSVSCFECHVAYLIDARDGSVRNIGHAPIMSPSGQLGFVWTPDFLSGSVGPYLIDFRSYPPVFVSAPERPNCGGSIESTLPRPEVIWLDESRIEFTGSYSLTTPERAGGRQTLRFVNGKLEWAEWQC